MNFKELPKEEKPRERLLLYGPKYLSNEELLMILLKTGTKNKSVKELANDILTTSHGLQNLKNITYKKLKEIEGIGQVKAIEILSLIELSKRINKTVTEQELISFKNPETILKYFNEQYQNIKQEEFYCIYLDNKKNI